MLGNEMEAGSRGMGATRPSPSLLSHIRTRLWTRRRGRRQIHQRRQARGLAMKARSGRGE